MFIIVVSVISLIYAFILCQKDGETTTVTKYPSTNNIGDNITLKCYLNETKDEEGVTWWNGTGSTGLTYTNTCQPGIPLADHYDLSRISASCDSTGNAYNITITTTRYDTNDWRCCFLYENGATQCSSAVSLNNTEDDKIPMYVAAGMAAAVGMAGIIAGVVICC